ncbi:MAG: response regulator [Pirellulaceae bacterium]
MAKTVLVVDDSRSIRQVVATTIRDAGYEVLEAGDGREALRAATGRKLSMVLTDLNMPVMDGLSFVRQLRTLPEHRGTPVLMLTTEFQQSRKEAGKAAGANGWIVKPIRPEQLLQVVEKVAR